MHTTGNVCHRQPACCRSHTTSRCSAHAGISHASLQRVAHVVQHERCFSNLMSFAGNTRPGDRQQPLSASKPQVSTCWICIIAAMPCSRSPADCDLTVRVHPADCMQLGTPQSADFSTTVRGALAISR
jgi:hypothetical protein